MMIDNLYRRRDINVTRMIKHTKPYDLNGAVKLPETRGYYRGKRRVWIRYRVRCAKCGNVVIVESRNPGFACPPLRLYSLLKCKCGCWTCGKSINRGG